MTTQYTPILKLALPVTGELSGLWGDVVNNNITAMVEEAIAGLATISTWSANSHTLSVANGTADESRCAMLVAATGSGGTALTGAGEIICPALTKLYVLKNGAAYAVTLKTASGTGVSIPSGQTAFLFCDGTNVNNAVTTLVAGGTIEGNLVVTGNVTLGDAGTDTVTVNGKVDTDLIPSTDNAKDLGTVANSWRTLYVDTSVLVANISILGNTISSTDTDGNIVLQPNGTGDVILSADTVQVGDANSAATITTNGAGNLVLSTNNGTNSGTISIGNGVNNSIIFTTNGVGSIYAAANTLYVGKGSGGTVSSNGGVLTLTGSSVSISDPIIFGSNTATLGIGSLAFNTDAFVVDANNKRIGVGIASPLAAVHVAGGLLATAYASNRIPFIDSASAGLFVDSANLTFTSSSNTLSVYGVQVGRGGGNNASNTRVGASALGNNSSGTNNTALGANALSSNLAVSNNTGVGYNALTGNSGNKCTGVGSGVLSGSSGNGNTALGYGAGSNINTGIDNIAVGNQPMAFGFTTGNYNVGIGTQALASLTTGSNNIGIGLSALNSTTTALQNIAIGSSAGQNRVSGYNNIALGAQALQSQSTTGSGNDNIAIGAYSLIVASTAGQNVAVGTDTLGYVTTGTTNVAVGYNAGHYIETGTNNLCIGYNSGSDALYSIGGSSSNIIVMGNNSSAQAFVKVSWTVLSDARDKTAFAPVPHGLNFVTQLKPTAYNLRKERGSDEVTDGSRVRYGFLAQDILALEGDNPVIIDNSDPEKLKYNEASLIPVLVNAIQELKAEVDALKMQLAGK